MQLFGQISQAAPSATSLAGLGSSSAAGTPWSAVLSAGLGVGNMIANAVSSARAFKRQKELMAYQADLNYKYNRYQTLNQYKWQRQGLSAADYNPLLALQGATGASQQNWSGAPNVPVEDFTGFTSDFSNATGAILQHRQFEKQLENIASQTSLNNSNIKLNTEKAINLAADTDLKNSEVTLNTIHKENLPAKYKAEIYHHYQSARSELLNAMANQTSANASQINANANRIKADSDVRYQDQSIEKMKVDMHLTEEQTEQIRQIMRWYGYKEGTEIIKNLAISGYFGTGAVKNLTGALKDITGAATDAVDLTPIPHNPVGF